MMLTYGYISGKFEELINFVRNSENAISQVQTLYNTSLNDHEKEIKTKSSNLRKTYDEKKASIIRKIDAMMGDATKIAAEIDQIEVSLISKDKYYKRTKDKKEQDLHSRRNTSYDSYEDYFEVLDKIRDDYYMLSKKYRESILPSIISGIHYIFSSKRKADYEELIVLKNTVQSFIAEIRTNVNEIKKDAINSIEAEYKNEKELLIKNDKNEKNKIQNDYVANIENITDAIEEALDIVFPDETVQEMVLTISRYQESLENVFDKKLSTKSLFCVYCVYLPISNIGASGAIYDFITDKLNDLIINTEVGDYLLMPCISYPDYSSNWYMKWDGINREYTHELANNVMFSFLSHTPVDQIRYIIIDPVSRGSSIRRYFDARKKLPEIFGDRIYINSSDVDDQLEELNDYIDQIMQDVLGTHFSTVFEYAENDPNYNPIIKNVVIFDFPKGINEGSMELLNNIVLQGPKCGIFTIIVETYDDTDQHHSQSYIKLWKEIQSRCNNIDVKDQKVLRGNRSISLLAEMPNKNAFSNYLDKYVLIRESIKNRGLVFSNMIKELLDSKEVEIAEAKIRAIELFSESMNSCTCFDLENAQQIPHSVGIGTIKYPDGVFEESCAYEIISESFSDRKGQVNLPFVLDLDRSINILLEASESNYNETIRFSHSIIWSFLSTIQVGQIKVCIVDAEARGQNARPFLDFSAKRKDVFLGGIHSQPKEIREQLQEIVNRMDNFVLKKLGSKYLNIFEYNNENKNALEPIILLVIYGYPTSLDNGMLIDLQQILKNGNQCGIYTIMCKVKGEEEKPKDIAKNNLLRSIEDNFTILQANNGVFKLVPFNVSIVGRDIAIPIKDCSSFVNEYIDVMEKVDELNRSKAPDNDYTALFDISKAPVYIRGNKKIHLPYGISADGDVYYCDFENDNFAGFLCGSSGSGKSTLLHSLITGILRDNHPDDVELWLADFKMKEFRRYVDNCPPHIKYILLEESPDAVYDFLDRMKEKLSERERMNSSFTDFSKAPISQYLPIIFVIIDEFSIMSQIIDQDLEYKLILQNLLAKGRALGFRFLFSSQTFTTGVTGLTTTAKKQIQMRLAMKCPQEEISETIDMSKSLMTEEQKRWLLTLPKYYILLKKLVGEGDAVSDGVVQDEVILTRAKGLYFPNYSIQNEFIKKINASYDACDRYLPTSDNKYKDKQAVIVDGSKYYSFYDSRSDMLQRLEDIEKDEDLFDAKHLFIGRPRSMLKVREISIENEFEENLICFGTNNELITSVLLSTAESLQLFPGTEVSFIGYSKNRISRKLSQIHNKCINNYITEELKICKKISDTRRKIEAGEFSDEYLLFAGLDVLLKNIELLSKSQRANPSSKAVDIDLDNVMVESDDERSIWDILREEEEKYGITKDGSEGSIDNMVSETDYIEINNESEVNIYDISNDLEFILREGPRFGIHCFLFYRTYDEHKQTRISIDLFKHKLTFQCSKDDSRNIIQNSSAFELGEVALLYTDLTTSFTMRPYLHNGLSWNGWETDDMGHACVMQEIME